MKKSYLYWIVFAISLIALSAGLRNRSASRAALIQPPPTEAIRNSAHAATVSKPVIAAPAPAAPVVSAVTTPEAGFAPGHFAGVSVRHEPGTHRPTPPEGTPRTVPKEQEITLPDGRKLIGITLDETWRIPAKATPSR